MPMNFEDRQPTRVYRREQSDAAETRPYDEQIGFTQPLTKPKGMFDGISIAQVVAGAAAAATSMLLASKIGIAGSVIGAAVSSAVTIVCSQLYRRALEKSAEKLKLDQLGIGTNGDQTGSGASAEYRMGNPYRSAAASAGAPRRKTRIAPVTLRERAAVERRGTQRKVLVASVVLAVAAVVFTVGIILLGTAGQGLGARPNPIIPALTQQQPSHGTAAGTDTAGNKDEQADASQQTPDKSSNETAHDDTTEQQPDDAGNDGQDSAQPDKPDNETDTGTERPDGPDSNTGLGTDSSAETGDGAGENASASR